MTRIAILGSCITRDLWPIRGGGAERLLYISRTSLPTLLAPPLTAFEPSATPPGDLHAHEHGALVADIRKTALARLVAYRPTHLIFDFIDDRFDLIAAEGSLVLNSGEMVRSGYRTQPALANGRTIPRLSTTCSRLWREAVAEFAAVIRATPLSSAQLILHSAQWADRQRTAAGDLGPIRDVEIVTGQPADIDAYNAVLTEQESCFTAMMPPMLQVDAPGLRIADSAHRWGLSPFHYIPEYYDEIRRQLTAIPGLADAFTAPLFEPSAPAA